MSKCHVGWIDAYKGVLIVLVVIGHIVGGAIHLMPEGMFSRTVAEYVFKFIHSFHMPAFFFVAGVTFGMGKRKTFREFIIRKVRRLIVPYFIFGIASGLLYLFLSGSFNTAIANHATDAYYADKTGISWWVLFLGLLHGGGWPNGQGFIANSVLWFLPCLFSVETAYYILDSTVRGKNGQLMVAGLFILLVFPLGRLLPQTLPWGLAKLPLYLPFMVLGRWGHYEIQTSGSKLTNGAILLVALVGCVIVTPNAWYATQSWGWSMVFIVIAIVGTGTLLCLIDYADCRMVRLCGGSSMTIMLLHKFLVVALQLKIPFLRAMNSAGGWRLVVATAEITIISVFICVVVDRLVRCYVPWMLGAEKSTVNSMWRD